ncbi:hypothetical protein F383_13070 [Gossypium arboreum]|uniref:Uncharacterized protein n=1 Tax=Gossypium arboreum TaxID=29729 RepID=A0A0B0PX43_GOSAR|nr:hypothetical protein F383_13070 [Gossypium arboreum]
MYRLVIIVIVMVT